MALSIYTFAPMTDHAAMPDAAVAMDRMYRWQRHIYDVTRKYYLLGRDALQLLYDAPGSQS